MAKKRKRYMAHKCVIYQTIKSPSDLCISPKLLYSFYPIHIFSALQVHISKLKEITSAFLEIFVPEIIFNLQPFHVSIFFKFVMPIMLI